MLIAELAVEIRAQADEVAHVIRQMVDDVTTCDLEHLISRPEQIAGEQNSLQSNPAFSFQLLMMSLTVPPAGIIGSTCSWYGTRTSRTYGPG